MTAADGRGDGKPWWQVLGVDQFAPIDEIETVFVQRLVMLEEAYEARDKALGDAIEAARRVHGTHSPMAEEIETEEDEP